MVKRSTLILLSFFCIINAQIALPTFQGVHKPHTAEDSSSETLTFNGSTSNFQEYVFTENDISWTIRGAAIYAGHSTIAGTYDGNQLVNSRSYTGEIETTDGSEFELTSFLIQGDSRDGATSVVSFKGYKNSSLVQSESRTISNSQWIVESFNWSDIDRFTWDPTSPNVSNVVLENMIYIP